MDMRIPVAVLGAAGSVGQRFVQLLEHHPWFKIVALTGSERAVGQPYRQACHWILPDPMPLAVRDLMILPTPPEGPANTALYSARLAFSALPTDIARLAEPELAQSGLMVCSNASAFRAEADVPLLLPEVNPDHAALLDFQRRQRGWSGGITTNPNCTSTGMTVVLKALQEAFGLQRVFAVSMQALSGAGYPGVASLDIVDNVVPYIGGEEDKVETEPCKMLGNFAGDHITPDPVRISAHTNRVAVSDGHMVCLSVELKHPATPEQAHQALAGYAAPPVSRDLPSAPHPAILVRIEPNRPQPRLDRNSGAGMTSVVGRLRQDPLFHLKLVVLSHNTIRGAAGGSLYNAELLYHLGYLP